jgi:nitrous oxide reductase accessory protein NosL
MDRRGFLGAAAHGLALTPLAATLASLGGCGKDEGWPEGMQPIKWDRDTCVVCNMAISDRRFAGQMRGGPKHTVFKFDDPGCIALWLNDKADKFPWIRAADTRIWVADIGSRGSEVKWLDARTAHYVTRFSPMGYNFGAVARPEPGAVDFPTMCEHVVAKVRKK